MQAKARFLTAFLTAAVIASLANALPYLLTRHAYQRDGQEVAGFPLAFHRIGGDCSPSACDNYDFHLAYFAADLSLALIFAAAAGLLAARAGKRKR